MRIHHLLVSLVPFASALSQGNRAGPPPFSFTQVAPGVYVAQEPRSWVLSPFVHGNQVFIVNDSDVFAFDANHTPSAARATLKQLRAITTKPIHYLMLSHWHGDHTMGVSAFLDENPATTVIASDSTRDDINKFMAKTARVRSAAHYDTVNTQYDSMARAGVDLAGRPLTPARTKNWADTRTAFRYYYGVEAPSIKVVLPTKTFADSLHIRDGGRDFDLISYGHGDTRGDGILWLPKERIVMTGDVLVEPAPYSGGQFPSGWLHTLRAIRALNPRIIIPGHGNVQRDTRYLDLVIETVDTTIKLVRRDAAKGMTVETIKKQLTLPGLRQRFTRGDPLTDDRWLDFLDGLVDGAYAETSKAPAKR